MIEIYVGGLGAGKTLGAVKECFALYRRGFTIYSNIGLKFPYVPLTKQVFEDLIHDKAGLQNAVILLDEIHIWIDSRSSMKKKNKIITYFLLQTRKRNVRLFCTTQDISQVDVRLRRSANLIVESFNPANALSLVKTPNQPVLLVQFGYKGLRMYLLGRFFRKAKIYANPYYALYDTNEIVSYEEE